MFLFSIEKDTQVSGEVEKFQRENEKLKKTVTELSAELKLVKVSISLSSWNILNLLMKQILIYLVLASRS